MVTRLDSDVGRILALLTGTIGLPYLVLAATGPLMQDWFRRSSPGASPYRLYALSNVGSLLALVSYPFVFETILSRQDQARFWSWGLGAYAAACAWCGWRVWRLAPTGQSVTLAQGTLGWRRLPERIEIADEKAVLARVQALGFTGFYSTKVSLSLSGLKKERDKAAAIAGVTFVPGGEDFWLKPTASDLELKPVTVDDTGDRR